jgi:hypothetical protein
MKTIKVLFIAIAAFCFADTAKAQVSVGISAQFGTPPPRRVVVVEPGYYDRPVYARSYHRPVIVHRYARPVYYGPRYYRRPAIIRNYYRGPVRGGYYRGPGRGGYDRGPAHYSRLHRFSHR